MSVIRGEGRRLSGLRVFGGVVFNGSRIVSEIRRLGRSRGADGGRWGTGFWRVVWEGYCRYSFGFWY